MELGVGGGLASCTCGAEELAMPETAKAKLTPVEGKPGMFVYSGPRPDAWKASTLRLIADHFNPGQKKVIIKPSREMREEWSLLLNQIADELEGGQSCRS